MPAITFIRMWIIAAMALVASAQISSLGSPSDLATPGYDPLNAALGLLAGGMGMDGVLTGAERAADGFEFSRAPEVESDLVQGAGPADGLLGNLIGNLVPGVGQGRGRISGHGRRDENDDLVQGAGPAGGLGVGNLVSGAGQAGGIVGVTRQNEDEDLVQKGGNTIVRSAKFRRA